MAVFKCPGDPAAQLSCIRGYLYIEDITTGTRTSVRPCLKCSGGEKGPELKVVQAPGAAPIAEKVAHVPEGTRVIHSNIAGHQREPINAKHEEHIKKLRDIGLEFIVALHDAGGTDPNLERFANRNLAIASTEVETAVMHAIKGVCSRK